MALFWGLWFAYPEEPERTNHRETILLTLGGVLLALFLARFLAGTLPYRGRPMFASDLGFKIPFGSSTCGLTNWSSFPSDHAALFMGLTTGIWFISRPLALSVATYLLLVILLPRIYMGFHYPTDLAAGAFLGVGCVLLLKKVNFIHSITQRILRWSQNKAGLFYALFFFVTFQIATLFDSVRHIGSALKQLIKASL